MHENDIKKLVKIAQELKALKLEEKVSETLQGATEAVGKAIEQFSNIKGIEQGLTRLQELYDHLRQKSGQADSMAPMRPNLKKGPAGGSNQQRMGMQFVGKAIYLLAQDDHTIGDARQLKMIMTEIENEARRSTKRNWV